jgi:hypothetical protein
MKDFRQFVHGNGYPLDYQLSQLGRPRKWIIWMYLKDGVEKDEEGQAKDKIVSLYLKSLEEESTDKCFVQLEVAVYSWIGSVTEAPPELVRREDS